MAKLRMNIENERRNHQQALAQCAHASANIKVRMIIFLLLDAHERCGNALARLLVKEDVMQKKTKKQQQPELN